MRKIFITPHFSERCETCRAGATPALQRGPYGGRTALIEQHIEAAGGWEGDARYNQVKAMAGVFNN